MLQLSPFNLVTCFILFLIVITPLPKKLRPIAPTIMTSLGVFGTFLGITYGLWNFDTAAIDQSIPQLLEGLKSSFITSIAGLFGSILVKIGTSFKAKAVDHKSAEEMLSSWYALHQKQFAVVEKLSAGLTDQGSDTVIGQIKLLRADQNDKAKQQEAMQQAFHERLWREMQTVTETLSRSATQEIIEALQSVIKDFNNQLTEQFGQNFKELNQAVFKLVTWQEQYKEQMQQMKDSYEKGVTALQGSEQALEGIVEHTQKIPETMNILHESIQTNQHTLHTMNEYLTAFAELKDKAVSTFPELKEQITETFEHVQSAHMAASEHHTQLLTQSKAAQEAHQQESDKLLRHMTDYTESTAESLKETSTSIAAHMQQTATTIEHEAHTIQSAFEHERQEFLTQSKAYQDAHQEESDKLLRHMTDYTESTAESLKENSDAVSEQMQQTIDTVQREAQSIQSVFEDEHHQLLKQSKERIQKQQEQSETFIEELRAIVEQTFNDMAEKQNKASNSIHESVRHVIEKQLQETMTSVHKQIDLLDKSLEEELQRALAMMGKGLTSVTQQFAQDYTQLTQQMQQVVSRSRHIN